MRAKSWKKIQVKTSSHNLDPPEGGSRIPLAAQLRDVEENVLQKDEQAAPRGPEGPCPPAHFLVRVSPEGTGGCHCTPTLHMLQPWRPCRPQPVPPSSLPSQSLPPGPEGGPRRASEFSGRGQEVEVPGETDRGAQEGSRRKPPGSPGGRRTAGSDAGRGSGSGRKRTGQGRPGC